MRCGCGWLSRRPTVGCGRAARWPTSWRPISGWSAFCHSAAGGSAHNPALHEVLKTQTREERRKPSRTADRLSRVGGPVSAGGDEGMREISGVDRVLLIAAFVALGIATVVGPIALLEVLAWR